MIGIARYKDGREEKVDLDVPRRHGTAYPSLIVHDPGYWDHPGYYADNEWPPKLGWEEVTFSNVKGSDPYLAKFDRAEEWIIANVTNWQEVCRWVRVNDCSYFYFVERDDAMRFKLVFG